MQIDVCWQVSSLWLPTMKSTVVLAHPFCGQFFVTSLVEHASKTFLAPHTYSIFMKSIIYIPQFIKYLLIDDAKDAVPQKEPSLPSFFYNFTPHKSLDSSCLLKRSQVHGNLYTISQFFSKFLADMSSRIPIESPIPNVFFSSIALWFYDESLVNMEPRGYYVRTLNRLNQIIAKCKNAPNSH